MADLKLTQHRFLREPIIRNRLAATGSEDLTRQGFRQEQLFEPFRYNFGGNNAYGTFGGLGAPIIGLTPFEVSLSNYTPNQEQFILDSEDGRTFIRLNTDNSITLRIGDEYGNWSGIPNIPLGETVGLRWVRVGNSLELFYYEPDGSLTSVGVQTFTSGTIQFDYVSTGRERLSYDFNNDTRLVRSGGGRTLFGDFELTITTSHSQISTAWRSLWGTSTGGNNEGIVVRDNGDGTYRISTAIDDVSSGAVDIPYSDIDWYEENRITMRRVGSDMFLLLNDKQIFARSGVGTGNIDLRQIGFSPWVFEYWDGVIHSVTGFDSTGTIDININTGTGSVVDTGTGGAGTWNFLDAYTPSAWANRQPKFTGAIYELFMGAFHWSMGTVTEYQTDTLFEDSQESGRDITIQNYLVGDWLDLGGGSYVDHVEDDGLGNGTAFHMVDDSNTLNPRIAADFTEQENTNFGTHGGRFSAVARFGDLTGIPDNTVLGAVSLTWDRQWDGLPNTFTRFDGVGGTYLEKASGTTTWRGGNDNSYLSFNTANMIVDTTKRAFFGGTSSSYIGYQQVGDQLELTMEWRGESWSDSFPLSHVDFRTANEWKIRRTTTGIAVDVNGTEVIAPSGTTAGLDFYTQYVGACSAFVERYIGDMWGISCSGTIASVDAWTLPLDEGTGDPSSYGQYASTWNLGTVEWVSGRYEGIVFEARKRNAINGIVMENLGNGGTLEVPNYAQEYMTLDSAYDPSTGELEVIINGNPIPVLSGTAFRYLGTDYCYDAAIRIICGSETTQSEMYTKVLEILSYSTNGIVYLTSPNFRNNAVFYAQGYRDITLVVPDDQALPFGSRVDWTSENNRPFNVTVRRSDDETQDNVLVNLTAEPQEYLSTNQGSIFCGNIPAVEGYSAYFVISKNSG